MKKIIIVSAVNFRSGGPLSILHDCIEYLSKHKSNDFKIIAIVHKKELLEKFTSIEIIEFPFSIRSYSYRLFLEYFHFRKISNKEKPHLWLSLHDITPNVKANIRAVYCHNPAPFYRPSIKEALLDPTFLIFSKLYMLFYTLNINKNNYIIVQQNWLRVAFKKITCQSIIVSHPIVCSPKKEKEKEKEKEYCFFFPTLPRIFKNIEVIINAVKEIKKTADSGKFNVYITINGGENKYSKWLYSLCKEIKNIYFIGHISREEVYSFYKTVDCLIFPSKLETWGLPITEFKNTEKTMLVADLPYAHETVGTYRNVSFFDPNSPQMLAALMSDAINGTLQQQGNIATIPSEPFAENWGELFDILLAEKGSKLE